MNRVWGHSHCQSCRDCFCLWDFFPAVPRVATGGKKSVQSLTASIENPRSGSEVCCPLMAESESAQAHCYTDNWTHTHKHHTWSHTVTQPGRIKGRNHGDETKNINSNSRKDLTLLWTPWAVSCSLLREQQFARFVGFNSDELATSRWERGEWLCVYT